MLRGWGKCGSPWGAEAFAPELHVSLFEKQSDEFVSPRLPVEMKKHKT